MIVTTTDTLPGMEITETLGLTKGNVVRAKHVGSDIIASLRSVVGGEIKEYTQLIAASREQALDRMIDDAKAMDADAIVGMRFTTSTVAQGSSEILAFGTAVKVK